MEEVKMRKRMRYCTYLSLGRSFLLDPFVRVFVFIFIPLISYLLVSLLVSIIIIIMYESWTWVDVCM